MATSHRTCLDALNRAITSAELAHTNCMQKHANMPSIISSCQHFYKLSSGGEIAQSMRQKLNLKTQFLCSINFDESLGNAIRITIFGSI
jgi:hypothetical protein